MPDMNEDAKAAIERDGFKVRVRKQHRRVDPCFMTGKGCVYTEAIDREIDSREKDKLYSGFMVIPFQPNVNAWFDLCLKRYLKAMYQDSSREDIDLRRADQVRRTGYVICPKICRRIQESDFVVVDISVPNLNVFYELGLAYGIGQKIIVVCQKGSFGSGMVKMFAEANCTVYEYENLDPISADRFALSKYVWQHEDVRHGSTRPGAKGHQILFLERTMDFPDDANGDADREERHGERASTGSDRSKDIKLDFPTHLKAAIGVVIDEVVVSLRKDKDEAKISVLQHYEDHISDLQTAHPVDKSSSFTDIRDGMHDAFCVAIRTGGSDCHPMAYFWLGFCHALGKNVIPVSVVDERTKKGKGLRDLAFDIRALWHMTFIKNAPETPAKFVEELGEILRQMILTDFSEWSRKRFWDELLDKRGKVAIFTGALHNERFVREMIGDWDLRAASELTSYFGQHSYRATIESPVYRKWDPKKLKIEEFREGLKQRLKGKNCIIIASADVNSLTTVALGKVYGIPEKEWFDEDSPTTKEKAYTVVAIKEKTVQPGSDGPESAEREESGGSAFYREEFVERDNDTKRGFESRCLTTGKIQDDFHSQTEAGQPFKVPAHLLIAPNPWGKGKYILVLNGISGPATFALTHVLTGGVSKEFVDYKHNPDNVFDPEGESEKVLQEIREDLPNLGSDRGVHGLQYFFEVEGGPFVGDQEGGSGASSPAMSDWRRIRSWSRVEDIRPGFKGKGA